MTSALPSRTNYDVVTSLPAGISDVFSIKTFVNCSLTTSKCESNDWRFGGIPGVCNRTTFICECPDGYSGLDDFDAYNDCHVVYKVRDGARITSLVFAILSLLLALYLTGKLLFKWGLLYIPEHQESNGLNESSGAAGHSPRKTLIAQQQQNNNNNNGDEYGRKVSNLVIGNQPPAPSPTITLGSKRQSDAILVPSQVHEENEENVEESHHDRNQTEKQYKDKSPLLESVINANNSNNNRGETISQRFGFLHAPGAEGRGSNLEHSSDVNGDHSTSEVESPVQGKSAPRKSLHNMLLAKDDVENYVAQSIKAVPKRIPRASINNIKQLMPSREVTLAPKTALADELTRKRRTLALVVLFLGFSLFMVIYQSLLIFFDQSHRNNDALANVSLSFIITCIICGIWSLAFIWFGSLPNLANYGRLFNIDSVLIRHPDLVRNLTIFNCVGILISAFLFLAILPAGVPNARYDFDTLAMIFGSIEIFAFCVTFLLICSLLLKCFNALLSNPLVNKASKGSTEDTVVHAKTTVKIAMGVCIVAGFSIALLFLLLAFSTPVRTNLWIISPSLVTLGCILDLIIMYIVVIRQSGSSSSKN